MLELVLRRDELLGQTSDLIVIQRRCFHYFHEAHVLHQLLQLVTLCTIALSQAMLQGRHDFRGDHFSFREGRWNLTPWCIN